MKWQEYIREEKSILDEATKNQEINGVFNKLPYSFRYHRAHSQTKSNQIAISRGTFDSIFLKCLHNLVCIIFALFSPPFHRYFLTDHTLVLDLTRQLYCSDWLYIDISTNIS